MMRMKLVFLLVCVLSLAALPALAGSDDFFMKDGRVFRSDTGKEMPMHALHKANTEKGTYLWIAAIPEMVPEMQGTERGVYIFHTENEELAGFLPLQNAFLSQVVFSQSGEKLFAVCDTESDHELRYYEFEKAGLSKKVTFKTLGHAEWIDWHRFVFTINDMTNGVRSEADKISGWHSVVVYDSAVDLLEPVKEATEKEDYVFYGFDREQDEISILRRTVQNKSDWGELRKVKQTMISASPPAAG
ncbi:MAG: hypothetical protein J6I40_00520 [Mailhella sp.]|nr:hypothetical protein [Mailhella sp.]